MKSQPPSGLTLEAAKEKILAKLRRAARRGAPRGGLGFTATAPYSTIEALEKGLVELERSGAITQIFTRPTPRFFLAEEAPQISRVAEKIAARAAAKSGLLLSLSDLEKALSAVEKPLAEKAAAHLVGEARLVLLRYQARDLYMDADALRQALQPGSVPSIPAIQSEEDEPATERPAPKPLLPKKRPTEPSADEPTASEKSKRKSPPTSGLDLFGIFGEPGEPAVAEEISPDPAEEKPAPVDPAPAAQTPEVEIDSEEEAVAEAYRSLVEETGSPDVEIAVLAEACGFPLPAFKEFLLAEHEACGAILVPGDWTLASDSSRAGSTIVEGERHLLVRFPDR